MSRKTKGKKPSGIHVDPARQREVVGIVLLAIGGLTLLSLLSPSQGALTAPWIRLLRVAFGVGYVLAPVGLALAGLWLILDSLDRRPDVGWGQPVGALILYLVFLGVMHVFAGSDDPAQVAAQGQGGGYLGLTLSQALVDSLGRVGAVIVLLALAGIGLTLLLGRSTVQIAQGVAGTLSALARAVRERVELARLPQPAPPWVSTRGGQRGESLADRAAQKVEELVRRPLAPPEARESPPERPVASPRSFIPRVIGDTRRWQLPNIADILEENIEQELSQSEIRQRVRVIEETLAHFGVPAKVVEVNQGPTVTQFGVEPGFTETRDRRGRLQKVKVKVSKISSLADDLALALAAAPIRIQAPVPGRSVVGIEVPNSQIYLVGLRGVMESEAFRQIKGPLPIALGQDVAGEPVAADLAAMPHLLIAGATGSGKSVCINSIITCLLCTHTPETLKLLMIDPKRVELVNFNGIPHLAAPVVVDLERVMHVLLWATGEMDRRFRLFARAGARNIEAYNALITARGEPRLPYLVLIVDELADLMMIGGEEVEQRICRLAQMARATGIHLVLATQRPSVDVVTGLIKANFPARISFAVTSQVDSRVILDVAGAEKLLGRGDMLYLPPDSSKILRLQGCFVSERELDRLVRYWKGMGPPLDRPEELVQQPLWEDVIAQAKAQAAKSGDDELWPEVMALVRQHRSVSVSLLQRRLRIGYARAARLMDLLEERGIVGPAEGSKPRLVLPKVDKHSGDRG